MHVVELNNAIYYCSVLEFRILVFFSIIILGCYKNSLKTERPEVHACSKHPVLLLPSGPDKVWALKLRESESINKIT